MTGHSILSLFLITQLAELNAQSGVGCIQQQICSAGQVPIGAVVFQNGAFVQACRCGCNPDLYDSVSPLFCAEPNVVNFNPSTSVGDCSCIPVSDPIPMAIEVTCNSPGGHCSCPLGTSGRCIITCDGTDDSCKDSYIECNNDGFDCIVNCVSEAACSGLTEIMGPAGAALIVNCIGREACKGSVRFNGETGTDLTVICQGPISCKGSDIQLNFGNGIGTVGCYGAPDSCQGVTAFNLPINARITPGVGFQCKGDFCPNSVPQTFRNPSYSPTNRPTSSPTPAPTDNPTNSPIPAPTNNPTPSPTQPPTTLPTNPTNNPTPAPTFQPTPSPINNPTNSPTPSPTNNPTPVPTRNPTVAPTNNPTPAPTGNPTPAPTTNPNPAPTANPTPAPTGNPTPAPTNNPTPSPTGNPTPSPTNNPTPSPTANPTPAPTNNPTPSPTNNPTPSPMAFVVTCSDLGSCRCPAGIAADCLMICDGTAEACKSGIIQCNNPGYDCTVNCIAENACSGAQIIGPTQAALTVNCIGLKSCGDVTHFNGETGTDLNIVCEGGESCKGNVQFNFGNGKGSVMCFGAPDSCNGAAFNLPIDAETTPGVAFKCDGDFCPGSAPNPFSNIAAVPSPKVPPQTTLVPLSTIPPPPEALPATFGPWCCRTRIRNFLPWAGICWPHTIMAECEAESNNRCMWDTTDCVQSARQCSMRNEICSNDSDCCSTVCRFANSINRSCR